MAFDLNSKLSAEQRGWGGPGRSAAQLTTLRCPLLASTPLPMKVDARIARLAQQVLDYMVAARARGHASALYSSGGYNKRLIAGSSTWSNHSWGLAMDLNAGANPRSKTFHSDWPKSEVDGIRTFLHERGFRWGIDYRPPSLYDPMHVEFLGTPADAAELTRKFSGTAVAAPTTHIDEEDPLAGYTLEQIAEAVWQHEIKNKYNSKFAVQDILAAIDQHLNSAAADANTAVHKLDGVPAAAATALLESKLELRQPDDSTASVAVRYALQRASEGTFARQILDGTKVVAGLDKGTDSERLEKALRVLEIQATALNLLVASRPDIAEALTEATQKAVQ